MREAREDFSMSSINLFLLFTLRDQNFDIYSYAKLKMDDFRLEVSMQWRNLPLICLKNLTSNIFFYSFFMEKLSRYDKLKKNE